MRILAAIALLALAGCGVDGAPQEPEISITGEGRVGVSGKL